MLPGKRLTLPEWKFIFVIVWEMFGVVVRWTVLLVSVCALGGLLVRPAFARDSHARSFTIRACAQSFCTLSVPQNIQAANMALSGGSASRLVVNIPSLHNGKTAQLRPASILLTMNMVCNRSHSLHIATGNGGLRSQTGPNAQPRLGFADRVDYATHANWGTASATLQTSGVSGEATPEVHSPGAFSGNFALQVSIDESGAGHLPLTAGTYTDTLTVTLSPHF